MTKSMPFQPAFRKILQGGLYLVTSNLAGALLGFILSVVIVRGLGRTAFGTWTFCLTWAVLLSMVCEFGLDTLLTRDAARSPQNANQFLLNSLAAKACLMALAGSGLLWFAPLLGIDGDTITGLRIAVVIAAAVVPYGSFTAIFRARNWMLPILWLNVAGLVIQLILSIWVIMAGGSILGLIWIAGSVDVLQLITAMILWWIAIRPQAGRIQFSVNVIFQQMQPALPFAAAAAIGAFQLRSSVLLLGYLRGTTQVAWFGAASRFSEAAKLIPNGVFGALYPAYATDEGGSHFKKSNGTLQFLAVLLALTLCFLARPLLVLSYGPDFLPGVPVLICLGLGLIPTLLNDTNELYLYAAGEEVYANRVRFISMLIQVGSGIVLAQLLGATGVALSIALAESVTWYPLQRRARRRMIAATAAT